MATDTVKILAIDDNADNLVIVKALIRETMPEAIIFTAPDGPSGLAVAENEDPDVILLDIIMPGMDGFEVCRRLKGDETLRDIPVVFVTAIKEDKANRIKALESGAEGFLAKPIDESDLIVLIRAMVRIRQANLEKRNEKALLAQLVSEQTRELRQAYVKTVELLADLKNESRVRRESEERALALVARLQEADSNKNRFISMLSHELRNPLAAITLSLSLIEQTTGDPGRTRKAWDIISRQTGQLTRIVDDLLDVTRINENKINLKKERVELNELVRRTMIDHQVLFRDKGVEFSTCLPDAEVWLDADPVRMTQVLENLLHNALKFTRRSDRVLIDVRERREHASVAIRVVDTGVGIEKELLDKLFQPFTQADRSLARSQGGLGLGLAIVKGIVDLHGGIIDVASDGQGTGTTFTITLPTVPVHGQAQAGSTANNAKTVAFTV